ncbi:PHD-type domain-containing protein [Plasmodiophora brassicae]
MTDRDDDCDDLPILIRIPRIVLERAARRQTETARAEDEVLDDERGRLCSFCKKTGEAIAAGALPDDRNDFIGPYRVQVGPDRGDRTKFQLKWAHRICAIWSPQVFVDPVSLRMLNVPLEIQRSRCLFCDYCRKSGASIGCLNSKCRRSFHLECAQESMCRINHKDFSVQCGECYAMEFFRESFEDCDPGSIQTASATELYQMVIARRKTLADEQAHDREEHLSPPKVAWEDVVGLDDAIASLKESVVLPLLYPELLSKMGIRPPRGMLLYGPPGTGKTLLARALCDACSEVAGRRITFFSRKGADIMSKYFGESERNLRELFAQAKARAPSVIFFDELDGLAPARSPKQNQVHSSIVCTLLSLMDGVDVLGNVFVLGATNRIDSIDPALRRPGRFDRELFVGLPDIASRQAMLLQFLPDLPAASAESLAPRCTGYSGAHMRSLCVEAILSAVRRVGMESLQSPEGINSVNVDISDFEFALIRVNPASSVPATLAMKQALPPFLKGHLQESVEDIMRALCAEFRPNWVSPSCWGRVLVDGPAGSGQQHVVSAVLHSLDQRVVPVVIELPLLHKSGLSLEAALVDVFKMASLQSTATNPSLVVIPTVDTFWYAASPSLRQVLIACLVNLPANVMVLSSCSKRFTSDLVGELGMPKNIMRLLGAYRVSLPGLNVKAAADAVNRAGGSWDDPLLSLNVDQLERLLHDIAIGQCVQAAGPVLR